MLEISDLTVILGQRAAVKELNVNVGKGEIVTLLGPTGCGKSTTLRAIAGLEQVDRGVIRIDGRELNGRRFVPPEKRAVGLVFQEFALFPHCTVAQNVGFQLKQPDASVNHWLRWLGLEAYRDAMPETLSGGQKQRVALARCLAHSPSVVLLDEPLSNLDAALKDNLRGEIRELLKDAGVAAIWVTHDQGEALSVGDRVGIMRDGTLEQIAAPEECFCQPVNRFVAEFLGEASFLAGSVRSGSVIETALGPAQGADGLRAGDAVDVLVRPDDLVVSAARAANGEVVWTRYEGGTRLIEIRLHETRELVRVRTNHEMHLLPGGEVAVRIDAKHPLAAFHTTASGKTEPRDRLWLTA